MEKSQVYFTTFKATGSENLLQKLHRLMKTAGFEKIDFTDKYAAISFNTVTIFSSMLIHSSLNVPTSYNHNFD